MWGQRTSGGHLGHCSNMLKKHFLIYIINRFWWYLNEEISGQRDSSGCSGSFDRSHLWVIRWSLLKGQIFKQPSTSKVTICQWVGLCQPLKSVHGDLFIGLVVRGQRSERLKFDSLRGQMLTKYKKTNTNNVLVLGQPSKSSWWPLHLTYG